MGAQLVPQLADVGVRENQGLKYTAWRYSTPLLGKLDRLPPPSGINYIATGVLTQQTNGQPMIEPAPGYTSFDLKSLRFGCIANVQSANGVPQTCTILVSGVQKSGKFVSQTLIFNPNPLPQASQFGSQTFDPAEFKNLIKVNFGLVQRVLPEILSVIVLDNVSYRAYQC